MGKADRETRSQDAHLARMSKRRRDAVWKMPPDERDALLSYEVSEKKGTKRRRVLGLLSGTAIGIYLAAKGLIRADVKSGEEHWPRTATELFRLDECAEWFPLENPPIRPPESFITIGGLGCVSSWPHAKPMGVNALGLPEDRTVPMSFLVTSNQGKTPEDVAKVIIPEAGKSEALSFYGHSNGGPTILEALYVAKQKYRKTIPIKRLVLNCSPFDFDDAREGFFGKALAKVAKEIEYTGGMYTKFLYQLWSRLELRSDGFIDRVRQAVKDSWHEASNGESPTPWLSDLYNLFNANLNGRNFSGIITRETEILYLRAPIDSVVDNRQASEKYQALARRYGAKFTVMDMPAGTTHADSTKGSLRAKSWVRGDRRRGGGAVDN